MRGGATKGTRTKIVKPIGLMFVSATVVAACMVGWYEFRLKTERVSAAKEPVLKPVPRLFQAADLFTVNGQRYQHRGRRWLLAMYLLGFFTLFVRSYGL